MPLTVSSTIVQRVSVYKILGVTVNSDLKWDDHVAAITSKAGKRLVYETVEKSRCFTRRSDVLLSVSCATSSRICVPVLALESNQRTDETT